MVWKYRIDKEKYVKQINDIQEQQKKRWSSIFRQKKIISGRREVEIGTLLLSNDKNNVIAEDVLSYF